MNNPVFSTIYFSHDFLYNCPSHDLRLDLQGLKYMYAMTFALEEINRDRTLLPGVKLGYSVFDSCRGFPWALKHALKLVAGNANSCNLTAPASAHENAGI